MLRRNATTAELKAYVSNAPAAIEPQTLVRMSGMRWPVEQCFEDSKQLLGMGDYQVRSWQGCHHHMTLVILAHFFLVRLQRRLKNAPALSLPQVYLLLRAILPSLSTVLNTGSRLSPIAYEAIMMRICRIESEDLLNSISSN